MKEDIWRLAGLSAAGFLIGVVLGHGALGLASGLAVYCYLLIRDSRRLYEWLHSRRDAEPPRVSGYHDVLVDEIQALRRQHRQREDKLTQFVKRIQEATTALPDAIVILDQNNHIQWANQQASDYLGVRWPQDADQRLNNLIRHPMLLDYLKQQGDSGDIKGVILPSPEDNEIHIEYRVILYGDSLRLLLARDVSRIYRLNQMRRDFIANASHELRTPLTVIAGYLEGFDGDMDSSTADLQPQFREMGQQTARMQALIEDLLTLSSLETEDDKREHTQLAVADMLATISREAVALSGEREHKVLSDIDQDLQLIGSYSELYSAFSNLVVNAVQYTPAGGVIRMCWYEDETGAHMKVSDTGEGIAPEHIPRLSERFYRVDRGRSRDSGGTGLGLAIVKHILQRHRGRLHIDSELGKGSVFSCDFPPELVRRGSDDGADAGRQQQIIK